MKNKLIRNKYAREVLPFYHSVNNEVIKNIYSFQEKDNELNSCSNLNWKNADTLIFVLNGSKHSLYIYADKCLARLIIYFVLLYCQIFLIMVKNKRNPPKHSWMSVSTLIRSQ